MATTQAKTAQEPPLPGYWQAYGGFNALLRSPFPYVAALITALCFPMWAASGWWATVISTLPTILGFTIAGFTVVLGLGAGVFRRQLHRRKRTTNIPLYLKVSAIFAHQIFVQTVALLLAIVLSAVWMWPAPTEGVWVDVNLYSMRVFWGLGFYLFIYSLLLVVAGGMNIYTLAKLIQRAAEIEATAVAKAASGTTNPVDPLQSSAPPAPGRGKA